MNTMKRCIVLGGLAVFLLLAACASSPEPFEYQQNNELKPGPGLLTGEEGVYTIYGPPPVEEKQPAPAEEDPAKPDAQ
jgi:hypothetical protein